MTIWQPGHDPMQRGFTLLEIALVVAVVALLTGGILVGRTLLNTAETTRAYTDISQYAGMIRQFESMYK